MNYRSVRAVNNSLMGVYEDDYNAFVAYWISGQPLPRKDDESLTMGSIVDVLLTKPESYDEQFIVFEGKSPTAPQMVAFCNKLVAIQSPELSLEDFYPVAYEAVGIKTPGIKIFVERFEEYKPYFDFLVKSAGKTVISKEQASKAEYIVDQLEKNKYTSLFVNAIEDDTHEVHNQLELYGTYNGIPTKGAIDRVLISHEKKIVQPIDFKTSYDVLSFRSSYFKYRYYRQGSYYTWLLEQWLKERGLEDYTIRNFIFVVCSTSGGQHWCYRMTSEDLLAAKEGGVTHLGYNIKGWKTILDEMVYMQQSNDWAFPYEAVVNKGIMSLNIFK